LRKFRTVARVRRATIEELTEVVGLARARKVFDHFHPNGEN
jgi:excinuclease UvrABC nuclease subunit